MDILNMLVDFKLWGLDIAQMQSIVIVLIAVGLLAHGRRLKRLEKLPSNRDFIKKKKK